MIGQITVTPAPNGVLLRIEAKGLTPGWHEKADCSDAAFKNAGAHVHVKTPVVHGLLNADANDTSDLPDLYVVSDGTATVELYSTLVTLNGEGNHPALLDADGSALVIHAIPMTTKRSPLAELERESRARPFNEAGEQIIAKRYRPILLIYSSH